MFINDPEISGYLKENFEVDDDNYYGLVDCNNYPYLCKLEHPIEYSDYIYNRTLPKQKLIKMEKYYKRYLMRKQREQRGH